MNSTFRDPFLGFDDQILSEEPSKFVQKTKVMENNNNFVFDADKNIDFVEFFGNVNLPSPPLSGNHLFEEDFDDDTNYASKNFNVNRDIMLSDVAVNRQISRESAGLTAINVKGEKNETKSDDEDDDSISSSEQLNILTRTAHDYERSVQQTATNPSFSWNAEQMNKFRNYYSSTKSSFRGSNDIAVEREVVVGRRPKLSISPMSSTDNKTRGAMYARQYRQKNKEFVDKMQSELDQLTEENKDLKETVSEMSATMSNLSQEVAYLRNVLANQSQLSSLIKGVTNTPGLKFRFPICHQENLNDVDDQRYSTRKRKQPNSDEVTSTKKMKNIAGRTATMETMPGVCLHVNGDNVSLEFCARCSNEARCDS